MLLPTKIVPFIWHFIKKQSVPFIIVISASIVWSLNEMLFPYFLKWIINAISHANGSPQSIYKAVLTPLCLLGLMWLLMEISMRIQGIILIYLHPKFRANIREAVFDYIKKHSHQYFTDNFAGSISKKLSELPMSCQTITEIVFFNLIPIFLAFIIAFFLMALTKWMFAFILLSWFLLHMAITLFAMKLNNFHWNLHSKASSVLSGKVVDSITNMLTVRLFARSQYESLYLKRYQEDEILKAHKALWSLEIVRIFQGLSALLFMIAIMSTLIIDWSHHTITVGDISLIGMLSFWILGMIWYTSYQLMVLTRESATIAEALNLITAGHDIEDKPHAPALKLSKGKICFNNVSFAYDSNKPIFKNLNISIKSGQKVGLVGFSGSGKSTLVNLLLRYYDIQKGEITIDGQDIASVTQDSLRKNIAMIPQDPTLFHRSLKENIRYGHLKASDEEIIQASKLAHCHEFIQELSEGYETLVGEQGVKLSGGQRQRIAIARAIIKNAPILILDEATSSLDSATEKLIQQSLQELMQNKTTIVIAHRLSTLADMDRILMFEKGILIEDGSIKELLASDSHFKKLWKLQRDGFLPE